MHFINADWLDVALVKLEDISNDVSKLEFATAVTAADVNHSLMFPKAQFE